MTNMVIDEELDRKVKELELEVAERKLAERQLKKNITQLQIEKDLFQEAISAVSHPFYVIDTKSYEILMANPAAISIFGDLSDRTTCYALTHGRTEPCAGGEHPCPLEIIKKTKQPVTVEHTHYDLERQPLFYEIHAYPVFDAEGNVTKIIEYSLEITKLKHAQEAQRDSEERYRELIEGAHDIIQSIRLDGTLAYVNHAWHKLLGYTETDLASINLFDIIHPDTLQHCQELFSEVMTGKSMTDIPVTFVAKDGTAVSVEGNVSPRLLEGKVVSTHAIFRDVTERKRAEAALKESEERYRELIENAHDIIQSIQPDGTLSFVNRAWFEILGYTEADLASMNIFDIIHSDSLQHCQELFSKVMTGQRVANIPATLVAKEGTTISVEGNVSPRILDGKVVSTHGIFRDVTERKLAEEKLARYSKHLEEIIAALNVAQEIQQSLLPQNPPREINFDLAGGSLYCDETGGDYYDYIELQNPGSDVYGVVIGDVSGHGIASALLMAGVRAYLRGRATRPGSPAEIITDVNRLVSVDTVETGQFMTLFFLAIEARTGRLIWVRAGHDPAIVYSPDSDQFEELKGEGLPLGVNEDWSYEEYTVTASPGQILILTTDGVWETHNVEGEMFGKKRFKEIIRQNAYLKAEDIRLAIIEAVSTFRGEASQEDDLTLVVSKFA